MRLAPGLRSLRRCPDGTTFKEITPPGYVEGSFVVKWRGVDYLIWSEGEWTGSDHRVAYATRTTPVGPFEKKGMIPQGDERVAREAGHHSVLRGQGAGRVVDRVAPASARRDGGRPPGAGGRSAYDDQVGGVGGTVMAYDNANPTDLSQYKEEAYLWSVPWT